jgi:hypothetical protein
MDCRMVKGSSSSIALRRALESNARSLKRANVGEFWVAWYSETDFLSGIESR